MKLTEAIERLGIDTTPEWGPVLAGAIAKAVRKDSEFLQVRLTENFELRELLVSQTAARRGISNLPNAEQLLALARLCIYILQPLRDHYGRAVKVTSGLRVPAVNRAVGGSKSSQHRLGEAADFTVSGLSNRAVCEYIRNHLPFDQLIYEFGERGWIHCSYVPGGRRLLTSAVKRGGRTQYIHGRITT